MATTGLKRPSDFEINCNASASPNWPVTNANKRLCLNNFASQIQNQNQQQQNMNNYSYNAAAAEGQLLSTTPFKYPLATMNPLGDDVNIMIKNEFHRANNHIHNTNHQHHHHTGIGNGNGNNSICSSSNSSSNSGNQMNATNQNTSAEHEPPVLSIRQTQLICEKIIREREQKLREEYDKILISKLSEQYDTFVKYTHDHIEKRYNESNSHQASYLS